MFHLDLVILNNMCLEVIKLITDDNYYVYEIKLLYLCTKRIIMIEYQLPCRIMKYSKCLS